MITAFITIFDFIKNHSSAVAKYTLIVVASGIFLIITFQVKSFFSNHFKLKEENILLKEKLNETERKIKNQELTIKNYKKIFQKEVDINLKLSKIKTDGELNFSQKNAKELNKILNCHIDNFKNLDQNCQN